MKLPESVKSILDALHSGGYEAYAVGGCVRDALLGKEPQDWDVTTSAEPEEIKAIFPVTIDTGIEHGTVTVRMNGESFEVTTFRTEGKYTDHRRPEEVHFTKSLEEDLLRRDFTINAMAFGGEDAAGENDGRAGLIDLYGGQQDLADGVIRCVGNPFERFSEDALRILRAFRFAAQLSAPEGASAEGNPAHFVIEPKTREAIRAHKDDLRFISAERIQMEMTKILTSPHPEIIRDMYELGVTGVILPEFDAMMETEQNTPHHCLSVGEHTIKAMQMIEPDPVLRWTMLIHDMGKPECRQICADGQDRFLRHAEKSEEHAREIMNRMKMDNATKRAVEKLVRAHDDRMPAEPRPVRRAINRIGEDLFEDYCKVRRADVMAQSEYRRDEKIENLDAIDALYRQILEEKQCVSLADLAVKGSDLIEAGVPGGPQIGEILQKMLDWVLDDPSLNEKEALLSKWRTEGGTI